MKFSKKYCLNVAIRFIVSYAFVAFMLLTSFFEDGFESFPYTIFIVVSVAFILFVIIYTFLCWKFITYEVKSDCIELKRGIIFKRRQILSFEKIHAIDVKRSLLSILLKTAVLNLDSGSTVSNNAEISIYHNLDVIMQLEKQIKNKIAVAKGEETEVVEEIKEENPNEYQYTFRDKILSLVLSVAFWFSTASAILVIMFSLIGVIAEKIGENIMTLILVAIVIAIALLLVIPCFFAIGLVIHYFQYKIKRNPDDIVIEFGLLSKVRHTLAIKRIKGVSVHQPLLYRVFGYASIHLEVVGFDAITNDNQEKVSGTFIPFCKMKDVNEILKMYLPEYHLEMPTIKSEKKAYKYYCYYPIILFTIILLPFLVCSIFNIYFLFSLAAYFLIILVILFVGALERRCQGVTYDEQFVYVSNGIFRRKYVIINRSNLIGFGQLTTYYRSKAGLTTVSIDYYNTASKNREVVHLVDSLTYTKLLQLLNNDNQ